MRKCWHWRSLSLHRKRVRSFLISALIGREIRLLTGVQSSLDLLDFFERFIWAKLILFLSLSRSPHTKWSWISAWSGGRPCREGGRRQWWWVGTGWTQKQNLHHPAGRFHPHSHHRHIRWPHQVGRSVKVPICYSTQFQKHYLVLRTTAVEFYETPHLFDTLNRRGRQICSTSTTKINLWKRKAIPPGMGLAFSLAHTAHCGMTQELGECGAISSSSCCPEATPSCVATAITNTSMQNNKPCGSPPPPS